MKKFGFLLLAACAYTNAMASEVGATFPQLANTPALMAVAIAETGASTSLALDKDINVTTANQHLPLEQYVERAYERLVQDIQLRIQRTVPDSRTIVSIQNHLP